MFIIPSTIKNPNEIEIIRIIRGDKLLNKSEVNPKISAIKVSGKTIKSINHLKFSKSG